MLKGHAIDILVRMNPEKKNYYKLVWEEYDYGQLLNYKLSNVFTDQEGKKEDKFGSGVTVKKYFDNVFNMLKNKL